MRDVDLVPTSAGADLLARGIGLNFDGAASISVPGITIPTGDFVAEGAPIPAVAAVTSAGPTLSPHKLAVITSLTGEMMRNANAETLVRQVLIESTGPAIDKALFSTTAGDTTRPAGLLNGITPLTPAAPGAKTEAMQEDLGALATAVAPVAGNGQIAVIAAPAEAVAIGLRLPREPAYPVLTSAQLATGTVIAIALPALVSAVEGSPQIDASTQAEFVRDTAPTAIDGAMTPPLQLVGSLYQTDEVGLRLRWPISWALRTSAGLAWMQSVNW
jgi:hypothetical protein